MRPFESEEKKRWLYIIERKIGWNVKLITGFPKGMENYTEMSK